MKVVILAGGLGTRIAEFTDALPKPMIPVGGHPLLWHILNLYSRHGHNDFYLALGYKAELIKDFFFNFHVRNADFTVHLGTGAIAYHDTTPHVDWRVTLADTGMQTMTGGRVRRMRSYIGNDPFLLTYGDGLADIDIAALVRFHRAHGKMVTVTAVHPVARFGELTLKGDRVTRFQEKPQTGEAWINGGFFVIEPAFLDLIDGDATLLEREPLERATAMGELMAYRHEGFWAGVDTKRDRDMLEALWNSGHAPWR